MELDGLRVGVGVLVICSILAGDLRVVGPEPPPACDWSVSWCVSLSFAAIAPAVAEFDWVTSPSEPGLRTRIENASFDGAICFAVASASAFCSFSASWPAIWV